MLSENIHNQKKKISYFLSPKSIGIWIHFHMIKGGILLCFYFEFFKRTTKTYFFNWTGYIFHSAVLLLWNYFFKWIQKNTFLLDRIYISFSSVFITNPFLICHVNIREQFQGPISERKNINHVEKVYRNILILWWIIDHDCVLYSVRTCIFVFYVASRQTKRWLKEQKSRIPWSF